MNLLFASLLTLIHPFFISVIEMKHNVRDKNIEISVRIFTDDLEAAIKKNSHTTIDLQTSNSKPDANAIIAKYLQSKLQFTVNDKPQAIKYLGYEIQKESVWVYAEISDVAILKKLNLNCTLLYDYQQKQTNILNIQANGEDKSYKLDYPSNKVQFSW
jgi:hypothetical protein